MEGLLRYVEQRTAQRSLIPSWSLIKFDLSEDSREEHHDLDGPKTVFMALKNCFVLWVPA